ncbi:macrophage mannose receptor 1-like [Anneissia japonica]|uniref:macrophage mannose receptor 1-like n=1 Tax=Anneissia japonica TaxID=1529436 RepID=UPI001425AC19|nr:macrophage mannose receptor 1-like [Anneissia japonica]
MAGLQYIAVLISILGVSIVSGLECPSGWKKWNDECYLFSAEPKNWEEARTSCLEIDGDLVSIDKPGENEKLVDLGQQNTNYWIGLTDRGTGSFVWSDGTNYNSQIAIWDSGYPQQASSEACVQLRTSRGYWQDKACSLVLPYICSRPLAKLEKCSTEDGWISGNSRCYLYVDQTRSWDDAQDYCDGLDGYLVSINNDEEQLTINTIASSKTTIWIGLSDKDSDGEYEWISGDNYIASNNSWDVGQPDASAGKCVEVLNKGSNTGPWSTAKCEDRKAFVCERGQLSCYPGWRSYGGNCYQFNTLQPETWINSKTICDAQGTLLVTIKSQEEQDFLITQFDYLQDINVENLWIGISDTEKDGERVWVDGTIDNGPYMNWPKRIYPENTPNTMDCGSMFVLSPNGQWDYGDCFNTYSYICKVSAGSTVKPYNPGNVIGSCEPGWDYYEGQCYKVDSFQRTFSDSKKACEDMDSVLTSILNPNEESFLSVRLNAEAFYIGLTDQQTEGTFLWIDGNPLSFTNWQKNEPNNADTGEDCVEIYGGNVQKGAWNDIPCSYQRGMICKKTAGTVTPHPPTNPPSIGCYDGDGSHYRGNAQISLSGKLCENWDGKPINPTTHPDADLKENFCRNPDNGPAPWCWDSTSGGSFAVEMCAIPTCSNAADCYEGDGMTYRGHASQTEDGTTCYRWDQLDSSSSYYPANQPYAGLDSNYCRNPSGSRRPWCYTDDKYNYGYCDLPKCNKTGCYEGNGQNYRGSGATTVDGESCSMWKNVSDQPVNSDDFPNADLYENYCRNPTGEDKPWCYIKRDSGNVDKKECDVPHCDSKKMQMALRSIGPDPESGLEMFEFDRPQPTTTIQTMTTLPPPVGLHGNFLPPRIYQDHENKFLKDSQVLNPTQEFIVIHTRQLLDQNTVTIPGITAWQNCAYLCLNQTDFYCRSFNFKSNICQLNRLNRDSAELSLKIGSTYFERNSTYDLEANYCRNPGGVLSKPWCYYHGLDGYDHWNFCAVEVCDALDIGCYEGAGEHYRGPARMTSDGQTCLDWDSQYARNIVEEHPNAGLDENFCRNPLPGQYSAPWCYHVDRGYVEIRYCDVPQCIDDKCGVGWVSDSKSDYCYQVRSDTSSTFNEALSKCMEQGGNLASITSVDESAFITGLVFKEQSPLLWVGLNDLYDEGGWEWTDGSPVAYFNFAMDQPDNSDGGQHCVVISAATSSTGQWYDESCDSSFGHVCKKLGNIQRTTTISPTLAPGSRCRSGWTSYGDSCYRVQIDEVSWQDALLNCKEVGADLASVHSQSEMMHIVSSVYESQHSHYWIAANDIVKEGTFVFSDGTNTGDVGKLVFNQWEDGQPNNYGADGEDCACLPKNFNWKWNDNNCAAKFRVLCEGIGTSPLQQGKFTAFKVEMSWADAEIYCQNQGGTLATISSQIEQDTAEDLLNKIYDPYEVDVYWFGSNDIAIEGTWVMGGSANSKDYQVYTNWYGNEPNNYKFPGEDCVMLVASDGNEFMWYDTTCTNGEGSICENIPGTPEGPNGLKYSVHMDLKTWSDASTFCKANGGRLAWILDQQAQDYIESLIAAEERGLILKTAGVWIGLNDQISQMSFQWSDGSDVTYTNWNNDEPNNWEGTDEDCVFAYTSTGVYDTGYRYYAGKWNDQSCDTKNMGYVCKKSKEILPITLVPPTSSGCKFGWKGYGSSCYLFDTTEQDWDTATVKCQRDLNADLVSISDR